MLERQGAGDLEVIDHDLHSVEQALQRRASGGFMLDAVKVALVVAVLPLVLTLRIATVSASGLWHRFPMFRWPWRRLEPIAHDVERAKSSIAAVVARMKGQALGCRVGHEREHRADEQLAQHVLQRDAAELLEQLLWHEALAPVNRDLRLRPTGSGQRLGV